MVADRDRVRLVAANPSSWCRDISRRLKVLELGLEPKWDILKNRKTSVNPEVLQAIPSSLFSAKRGLLISFLLVFLSPLLFSFPALRLSIAVQISWKVTSSSSFPHVCDKMA